MPVFVFLSGFFSSPQAGWGLLWKRTKRILLIYLIAQTLHNLLCFFTGEPVGLGRWLFITPQFALWYLMSLAFWRYGLKLLAGRVNDYVLLFGSLALAVLVGFIPIDTALSFQRTFTFLPFFVLGYFFRRHGLVAALEKRPWWIYLCLTLLSLAAARYLPVYMPNHHYGNIGVFAAQTLLGLILCVSIIRLSRIRLMERFARYGKYTLWIYIGHTFLVVIQNALFRHLGLSVNIWMSVLLAAFYVALITAVAVLWDHRKSRRPAA